MNDKQLAQIEQYTGMYTYLDRWTLHRLGWTDSEIKCLPEPWKDGGYRGRCLWDAQKVEEARIRLSPECEQPRLTLAAGASSATSPPIPAAVPSPF